MKKIKLFISLSDMDRFLSTRQEMHNRVAGCDCCDYEALCAANGGNEFVELIVLDDSWFEVQNVRESEKNDDPLKS